LSSSFHIAFSGNELDHWINQVATALILFFFFHDLSLQDCYLLDHNSSILINLSFLRFFHIQEPILFHSFYHVYFLHATLIVWTLLLTTFITLHKPSSLLIQCFRGLLRVMKCIILDLIVGLRCSAHLLIPTRIIILLAIPFCF
jgi:hypothetical protein